MKRMMLFVLLAAALAFAFENVSPRDAAQHVGEKVTVCGKVASAKYAVRSGRQPTFLNLDEPYPRQVFTAVIWGSDRGSFPTPPEIAYANKTICVTGTVQLYRGIPEIIVRTPAQIEVR